jgi:hypothetical protein
MLNAIVDASHIRAEVVKRFSIDKIQEPANFLSLLYYMGLVTKDKDETNGVALLKIPNYAIKTMWRSFLSGRMII